MTKDGGRRRDEEVDCSGWEVTLSECCSILQEGAFEILRQVRLERLHCRGGKRNCLVKEELLHFVRILRRGERSRAASSLLLCSCGEAQSSRPVPIQASFPIPRSRTRRSLSTPAAGCALCRVAPASPSRMGRGVPWDLLKMQAVLVRVCISNQLPRCC